MSWVNTSPAVAGDLVLAGSSDERFLQAVDVRTGRERWRFTTLRPVWSSPAVAGDLVYVGDGSGSVYALDRATGTIRWRHRAGRRWFAGHREPSVVVFAMDHLPAAVAPTAVDTVLFRRYLDAGGKAVWTGIPPLVWP